MEMMETHGQMDPDAMDLIAEVGSDADRENMDQLAAAVEISREVQPYEIEHEGAMYIPDQDDCMEHGSLSPGDSCGQQFSYAEMSLYGCDYSAEMQDSYAYDTAYHDTEMYVEL